jgi:hypothetical protein
MGRLRGWKIRRMVNYPDGGHQYQFLRYEDRPPNFVDMVGEWVDDWIDGTLLLDYEEAKRAIAGARQNNINRNVICHTLVEA